MALFQVDTPVGATLKRLAVFLLGAALVALNKKLNLGLDDVSIASLVALVIGYIFQSAANEAHQVRSEAIAAAAAKVPDLEAAAAVLSQKGPIP